MTRPLLAAAALALAALALPGAARAGEPFQLLSAAQVEKMLRAPDVRVYDVNIDELWVKHHLPGAIHVGNRDLATLLPADKGTRLVFYCSGPK
jgi:rhodanese-related sulfurtransferase